MGFKNFDTVCTCSNFIFVGTTSGDILQQCDSCPVLPGYNASCHQEDRLADDKNHANISIRVTQCSWQYICWTGKHIGVLHNLEPLYCLYHWTNGAKTGGHNPCGLHLLNLERCRTW